MQMKRNLSQAKQETLPVWEGFLPIKKNVFCGTAGAGFEPADPGYEPGMHANASPAIFTSPKTGLKVLKIRRNTQIEDSFADRNAKTRKNTYEQ